MKMTEGSYEVTMVVTVNVEAADVEDAKSEAIALVEDTGHVRIDRFAGVLKVEAE